MDASPEWSLQQLPIGRGRRVPADGPQIGGEYLRIIGPRIVEDGLMAVGNDRGIDFIAPQHFECLALGVVIDAGEARANECLCAAYALNKPAPRAHLDEITRRGNGSAAPHDNPLPNNET